MRAVPCEPFAACAMEPVEAPDILRPPSARAPLLCTPETEALVPEPVGENELPLFEPLVPATAAARLDPCAEPLPDWDEVVPLGLFLADPRAPTAACASDCEDAPDNAPLDTAWALALCTPVVAARLPEAEGASEALEPLVPDTAEAELVAEAELP